MIHCPVLLNEVMDILSVEKNGIYVDGTIGSGGHSEEILKRLGSQGRIIGIDRDRDALEIANKRLNDPRVVLIKGDFSNVRNILYENGINQIEGILLDLGVSLMQIKRSERGFSFHSDATLDMRMDRSISLSAREVVNQYTIKRLEKIIRDFGEEYRYHKIARAIVNQRNEKAIDTCKQLALIIEKVYGKRRKIHPATKTFQALRIFINNELKELNDVLKESLVVLKKGGKLCVISYHSLEDRIVKNFLREESKKGVIRTLTKKPVITSLRERNENPLSRSAKLRGGEKT